jgi:predicted nucleic acid-binding Zn ribbon protein
MKCLWHLCSNEAAIRNNGKFCCNRCKNIYYVTKRRKDLKKALVEYKGGICENCGYNKCIAALDFHHKNPKEKEFGLSQRGLTKSLEILKKEADKCLLLCANCHRETHDALSEFKDTKTIKTYKKNINCKVCKKETHNTKYCSYECSTQDKRKVERPSKNKLIQMLKDNNWTKVGKIFNVTDNTIRKWAKSYNIPTSRKEIIKIYQSGGMVNAEDC